MSDRVTFFYELEWLIDNADCEAKIDYCEDVLNDKTKEVLWAPYLADKALHKRVEIISSIYPKTEV